MLGSSQGLSHSLSSLAADDLVSYIHENSGPYTRAGPQAVQGTFAPIVLPVMRMHPVE